MTQYETNQIITTLVNALEEVIAGGYLSQAREGDDIIDVVNAALDRAKGQ